MVRTSGTREAPPGRVATSVLIVKSMVWSSGTGEAPPGRVATSVLIVKSMVWTSGTGEAPPGRVATSVLIVKSMVRTSGMGEAGFHSGSAADEADAGPQGHRGVEPQRRGVECSPLEVVMHDAASPQTAPSPPPPAPPLLQLLYCSSYNPQA